MTPEDLTRAITHTSTDGSNETEVMIGTDSRDYEVILRERLLHLKCFEDVTVKINAVFESKPMEDGLYIVLAGGGFGMGFKLNPTNKYNVTPYQGISGKASFRALQLFDDGDPRPEPVSSRRWPQHFQLTIKPLQSSCWGMCCSALDGGHSYSVTYPDGIPINNDLLFCLYRGKRTDEYVINSIEISVYGENVCSEE